MALNLFKLPQQWKKTIHPNVSGNKLCLKMFRNINVPKMFAFLQLNDQSYILQQKATEWVAFSISKIIQVFSFQFIFVYVFFIFNKSYRKCDTLKWMGYFGTPCTMQSIIQAKIMSLNCCVGLQPFFNLYHVILEGQTTLNVQWDTTPMYCTTRMRHFT